MSDHDQKSSLEMVDERFYIIVILGSCSLYFCQIPKVKRWRLKQWTITPSAHNTRNILHKIKKKDRTHLQEQEDGFHKEAVPSFPYRHVASRSAIFVGSLDWRIARTSNIFTDTWPFVSARQKVIWFFVLTLLAWIFFLWFVWVVMELCCLCTPVLF